MPKHYIDAGQARFTKREGNYVDAEFFDGTAAAHLEPRRLFPLSGLRKYITLLDDEGKEQGIIRDLDALEPEQRQIIEECLNEYYMIPKIVKVYECYEKDYVLHMIVDTDQGHRQIHIRNRYSDMKLLYDNRVLIRDADDNRYEIPNWLALDKKSIQKLKTEL